MDLKKSKKLKKKFDAFKVDYKPYVGLHVYRSEDKDAPFSEWERITDEPRQPGTLTDEDADRNSKFYYYKTTEVDVHGNESEPYDVPPRTATYPNGVKYTVTPETFIAGINLYWSTDPDLPVDQWTRQNDEPIKEESFTGKCPVKVPYYMYCKYVNALGKEFGKPSDIQRIVPQP